MIEPHVDIEAPSFQEAVARAAEELCVAPADLSIEIVDPGSSATSRLGFRPVRIHAKKRQEGAAPDGAHQTDGDAAPRYARAGSQGPRRPPPSDRRDEPPPPLDPSLITQEHVQEIRTIAAELVERMGIPGAVTGEIAKHGVRVAIDAGDRDHLLIGHEGETLSALQYVVGRILRARNPGASLPRFEIDVAGFRDRQIQRLRELARELVEEVREHGGEASTDPLPASERRIVHLEVAEVPGMTTVTVGDGQFKRVIVRRADTEDDAASTKGGRSRRGGH